MNRPKIGIFDQPNDSYLWFKCANGDWMLKSVSRSYSLNSRPNRFRTSMCKNTELECAYVRHEQTPRWTVSRLPCLILAHEKSKGHPLQLSQFCCIRGIGVSILLCHHQEVLSLCWVTFQGCIFWSDWHSRLSLFLRKYTVLPDNWYRIPIVAYLIKLA